MQNLKLRTIYVRCSANNAVIVDDKDAGEKKTDKLGELIMELQKLHRCTFE